MRSWEEIKNLWWGFFEDDASSYNDQVGIKDIKALRLESAKRKR